MGTLRNRIELENEEKEKKEETTKKTKKYVMQVGGKVEK